MTEPHDPALAVLEDTAPSAPLPKGNTAPAGDDRRRGQRAKAVLLIGKLTQHEGELLCLVQDLSQYGAKIKTGTVLHPTTEVMLALSEEFEIPAVVRWARNGEAGLEFRSPELLSPEALLNKLRQRRRRHPRFTRSCQALLEIDGQYLFAELINIGPGGAALTVKEPERIVRRMRGRLTVHSMDCVSVQILWTRGDTVGLAFDRPLGFAALNRWFLETDGENTPNMVPRDSPPSFSRLRSTRFGTAAPLSDRQRSAD